MSENNALVIFGSTGDLTFQKLLPALARLHHLSGHLIQKIFLIGRQGKTLEDYIAYGIDHGLDAKVILPLMDKLQYVFMQASEKESYVTLSTLLKPYTGRYIYLATPPSMFHLITASLSDHGLIEKGNPYHRCAYEKPFGDNGSAANVLNDLLHEVIEENQLYRVDHYLAKPLIQQLIAAGGSLTGAPWFCDAAFLAVAGTPAVAIGPGSIAQAHTKDEFIAVSDLEDGVAFFRRFLQSLS